MATHTSTTAPIHRLSVEDVLAMVEAEILDEHARVELLEGVLVEMNPIGAEHSDTVATLTKHFVVAVAEPLQVRVQDMLEIPDDGYVLPDLAVIEPLDRDALPTTALLVVEVSQTSQVRDREKIALYAALHVAEYWIVDLAAEAVTVHRGPSGPLPRELGRSAFYRSIEAHRDGAVAPGLDGVPPVPLAPLFGR